jgi:hypothetical protein
MRLSALTALVAGAGIVAAVPIRVIVVSSNVQESHPLDHVRLGHSVPQPAVARITMATPSGMRRPCSGRMSRFRQKGIEISNVFRGALGLPLIDANAHLAPHHKHNGMLRILPTNPDELQFLKPVEPKPNDEYRVVSFKQPVKEDMKHKWGHTEDVKWLKAPESSMNNEWVHPEEAASHHHGGPHHHGPHPIMHMHRGHRGFVQRLHYSLMNLGLWEGRAVAFVLGCGIGVLLRMFWVLAIVAYRVIKRRPEEDEYTHITIFEEVEVEAPPHYAYPVDEKIAVESETKAAEPVVAASNEESK